jgi:aminoglycoside 3-N-acetyltransferase
MIAFRQVLTAIRELQIPTGAPVIAHASLSAFGTVNGGAQTMVGALVESFDSLIMPGFTYKTMVVPEVGPPNNGIAYGHGGESNRLAEFFHADLQVDRLMGRTPEMLRHFRGAARSVHPILSFVGVGADEILATQTIAEPLLPVARLAELGGWVLLLGVGQDVNTSIHYAERLAERMQFVRWALREDRVIECPGFPGCSDGFNALEPSIEDFTRQVRMGKGRLQAVSLDDLLRIARELVEADPLKLLCNRPYCERCAAVRRHVQGAAGRPDQSENQ